MRTGYFKFDDSDRLARVDGLGDAHLLVPGDGWLPKPDLDRLVILDPDMSWDKVSEAEAGVLRPVLGLLLPP